MKDIDNSCEKPLRCSNDDDETWIDTDDENDANEKSVVSRFKVSDSVQANISYLTRVLTICSFETIV